VVIEGIEGKNRNRHTLRRCRGSVQPSTTENAISRPLGVSALCAWVCTGLCFSLCPACYLLDFVILQYFPATSAKALRAEDREHWRMWVPKHENDMWPGPLSSTMWGKRYSANAATLLLILPTSSLSFSLSRDLCQRVVLSVAF